MQAKPRGGALRLREALAAANDLQMSACRPGIPEQDPCRQEDVQDGPRGKFEVNRVSGKSFSETEQWNGPGNTVGYSIPYRLMFSCRCTLFELTLLVDSSPQPQRWSRGWCD